MAKCKDCGKEIEDKYQYCFIHSKTAMYSRKGREYLKYRQRVLGRWEKILTE